MRIYIYIYICTISPTILTKGSPFLSSRRKKTEMGFVIQTFSFSPSPSLFPPLILLIFLLLQPEAAALRCDVYAGRWVMDPSYPLYDSLACPFLSKVYGCRRNGRSDVDYTKYRWQPNACKLARFDGIDFMRRFSGKKIMYVGDSLSKNQWESLNCILYASNPKSKYTSRKDGDISTITFLEYDLQVMLDQNVFLVDVVNDTRGRILKLNSIEKGKIWSTIDVLIFNTWHWWNRRGSIQPWDFVEVNGKLQKDIDRMEAFEIALGTWGKWVDDVVDPSKMAIFYQGISPSHYNGTLWGDPKATNCFGQTQPYLGSIVPELPPQLAVLKRALSKIKKSVTLLDVTPLSLLRPDGHPSIYGFRGRNNEDCTHWCLPGVPDAWNEIFYNYYLSP